MVGPILSVEKVMGVFQRITSITTPTINSKLAIPYQKDLVKSSNKFKQEYEGVKSDLRKISGGLGKVAYQFKVLHSILFYFNFFAGGGLACINYNKI